jgi:hypothetical protein
MSRQGDQQSGLLDPEDKGIILHRNVYNYLHFTRRNIPEDCNLHTLHNGIFFLSTPFQINDKIKYMFHVGVTSFPNIVFAFLIQFPALN